MEMLLLTELGFSLYAIMDHPHKFILYYVHVLVDVPENAERLAQRAWGYLNDSLRLDCCVRYPASAIACAAIFLAARSLGQPLPHVPGSPPWWALFDTDSAVLVEIARTIISLYELPAIRWLPPLAAS